MRLLADWGIYRLPGWAKQLGFEASSWARRLAKVFLEALQAVGPLGEMSWTHGGAGGEVTWSSISSRGEVSAGAFFPDEAGVGAMGVGWGNGAQK